MDRIDYDVQLADAVLERVPDLKYIFCLGWMHILSAEFIDKFLKTLINLHPAPPGRFPGRDAVAAARVLPEVSNYMNTGVMVHYVTPEVDVGEVIDTITVPIYKTDTIETLRYVLGIWKKVLLKALKKVIYF